MNTGTTTDEIESDERLAAIPANPLGKIALSLSGGGYRAASFHLGAMSYLNKVEYQGKPLLENVKLISTVSGGTITGAVYALMKQEGKDFKEVYDLIMGKLHSVDLLKDGLEKLNPNSVLSNPYKRKNLINAFSELYDTHFTKGATFASFETMKSHLEAVVFNSTEFSNAVNFRFRNNSRAYFGNDYIRTPRNAAHEVKIADAIASSSCFPGGFEPMRWPHDFVHDASPNLKAMCEAAPVPIGIMDGGIYDNQGTQSILMYKKDIDPPYFDLVIISDVASPYMDPYKPFGEQSKEGIRNLTIDALLAKWKRLNRTMTISLLALMLILFAIPFAWQYRQSFGTGLCIGLAFIPLTLLLMKFFVVSKGKSLIGMLLTKLNKLIGPFYVMKLRNLKITKLSIHRLEPLIMDRVNSLITLLLEVFLKVVRRLNYSALYEDNRYEYRRISNLVRELTRDDFNRKRARTRSEDKILNPNSPLNGSYDTVVSTNISALVEEAAQFGTTLWFTDDNVLHNMLDKLVATGQITMCYNLIEYLEKVIFEKGNGFSSLAPDQQKRLRALYVECVDDWTRFKKEPMALVEGLR